MAHRERRGAGDKSSSGRWRRAWAVSRDVRNSVVDDIGNGPAAVQCRHCFGSQSCRRGHGGVLDSGHRSGCACSVAHVERSRAGIPNQFRKSDGYGYRSTQRMRHGFIVAQLAFAFVLLLGAGLLGLSLKRVLDTPSGFRPEQTLTARIRLPAQSYPDLSVSGLISACVWSSNCVRSRGLSLRASPINCLWLTP